MSAKFHGQPFLVGTSADKVEYNGGNVKDALDDKVSKSGDTINGNLSIGGSYGMNLPGTNYLWCPNTSSYLALIGTTSTEKRCAIGSGFDMVDVKNSGGYGVRVSNNSFAPLQNSQDDLGAAGARWRNIYGDNIRANTHFYGQNHLYLKGSLYGYDGTNAGNSYIQVQTGQSSACHLGLQSDRNLVYYIGSKSVWQSGTSSSEKYKHNIEDMTEERARQILDVRTVTFDYNEGVTSITSTEDKTGVIAEEVENVISDVVVYESDDDGNESPLYVDYASFVPYLIKMVQMQQKEIDDLKEKISLLGDMKNE